jgi:hypothetical protein
MKLGKLPGVKTFPSLKAVIDDVTKGMQTHHAKMAKEFKEGLKPKPPKPRF